MSQELNYSQSFDAYVTKSGEPFKTEQACRIFAAKANIKEYEIIPIGNRYGVRGEIITEPTRITPSEPQAEEKYWRVKFHAKSRTYDQTNVELHVNDDVLLCQREREVTIPDRFKECAEHATFPKFKMVPGKERKEVGTERIFPFDVLGEGKKEDYLKLRREGTMALKKDFEEHGLRTEDS